MQTFFADVILPLPIEARFTYRVPQVLNGKISFGMRVIVPFGNNKLYRSLILFHYYSGIAYTPL